jgi:hypothetical protein
MRFLVLLILRWGVAPLVLTGPLVFAMPQGSIADSGNVDRGACVQKAKPSAQREIVATGPLAAVFPDNVTIRDSSFLLTELSRPAPANITKPPVFLPRRGPPQRP